MTSFIALKDSYLQLIWIGIDDVEKKDIIENNNRPVFKVIIKLNLAQRID